MLPRPFPSPAGTEVTEGNGGKAAKTPDDQGSRRASAVWLLSWYAGGGLLGRGGRGGSTRGGGEGGLGLGLGEHHKIEESVRRMVAILAELTLTGSGVWCVVWTYRFDVLFWSCAWSVCPTKAKRVWILNEGVESAIEGTSFYFVSFRFFLLLLAVW